VLKLVEAESHGVLNRQAAWDVPRDPHAALVRLLGDRRHEVGVHQVVELDLLVA
jgi:hypothetical protein